MRLDGSIDEAIDRGSYRLAVTKEEADTVYFSEKGKPDPAFSAKVSGNSFETIASKVWFLAVNSKGEAKTGDPLAWEAPINLRAWLTSTSGGYRLETLAVPRASEAWASFDASIPAKDGAAIKSGVALPTECQTVRVAATIDGRWSEEQPLTVSRGGKSPTAKPTLKDDRPVKLVFRVESTSTKDAYDLLVALREAQGAKAFGGRIEASRDGQDGWLEATFGATVGLSADGIDGILKTMTAQAGFEPQTVSIALNETCFATGKDFRNFADKRGLDFETLKWTQG